MENVNEHEHHALLPWFIIASVIAVVVVVMTLFVSLVNSQQSASDQKTKAAISKAAILQTSVDSLRQRVVDDAVAASQDRRFFELVRQLLIAPTKAQRDALLNELKTFKFVEPTPEQAAATHTTSKSRATPTTRAPPAPTTTTSTTSTTRPTSPPPTTCVIVPVLNRQICH